MEKIFVISIIANIILFILSIILIIYYRKKVKKSEEEGYQSGGLRAIDKLLNHQKC